VQTGRGGSARGSNGNDDRNGRHRQCAQDPGQKIALFVHGPIILPRPVSAVNIYKN
jgi:hypothetical protein